MSDSPAAVAHEAALLEVIKPEEHDRQKFIGGSDIAAVLGISPWRTPFALWKDKSTPRVEGERKRVFRRGQRWEAVVAEMLVESLQEQGHSVEIISANKRYRDPIIPFFAAEIDFELRLDGAEEITNCELKTVHPFKASEWGEQFSDTVPIHYAAQAMWGLGITGRNNCIVAALFGADELKPYPIARDDETIAAMRARAQAFWTQHVITGIPPEMTTIADVDMAFKKDGDAPALIADDELQSLWLRARAIDREIKAREAEFEAIEFQIKRAMRDCTEMVVEVKPGEQKTAVVWKNRPTSWLDQHALKEAWPKIVREFTRKGETRVFTVK